MAAQRARRLVARVQRGVEPLARRAAGVLGAAEEAAEHAHAAFVHVAHAGNRQAVGGDVGPELGDRGLGLGEGDQG